MKTLDKQKKDNINTCNILSGLSPEQIRIIKADLNNFMNPRCQADLIEIFDTIRIIIGKEKISEDIFCEFVNGFIENFFIPELTAYLTQKSGYGLSGVLKLKSIADEATLIEQKIITMISIAESYKNN